MDVVPTFTQHDFDLTVLPLTRRNDGAFAVFPADHLSLYIDRQNCLSPQAALHVGQLAPSDGAKRKWNGPVRIRPPHDEGLGNRFVCPNVSGTNSFGRF